MSRILAAAGLALLLAACGSGSGSPLPGAASSTASAPATAPPASPSSASVSAVAAAATPRSSAAAAAAQPAQLYFEADGKLVTENTRVSGQDPALDALHQLLQGPKTAGHYTDIPNTVSVQDVSVKDGVATVSLDRTFFASGGSAGVQLRVAQVVFTLTQFPTVTSVQLLEEGQPATVVGGEGFPVNRPLTRGSFSSLQA